MATTRESPAPGACGSGSSPSIRRRGRDGVEPGRVRLARTRPAVRRSAPVGWRSSRGQPPVPRYRHSRSRDRALGDDRSGHPRADRRRGRRTGGDGYSEAAVALSTSGNMLWAPSGSSAAAPERIRQLGVGGGGVLAPLAPPAVNFAGAGPARDPWPAPTASRCTAARRAPQANGPWRRTARQRTARTRPPARSAGSSTRRSRCSRRRRRSPRSSSQAASRARRQPSTRGRPPIPWYRRALRLGLRRRHERGQRRAHAEPRLYQRGRPDRDTDRHRRRRHLDRRSWTDTRMLRHGDSSARRRVSSASRPPASLHLLPGSVRSPTRAAR